jgi:hypothetical protein
MSEKPKRSWFRFHLSSAVALSVFCSGMLFLSVGKRIPTNEGKFAGYSTRQLGWPIGVLAIVEQPDGASYYCFRVRYYSNDEGPAYVPFRSVQLKGTTACLGYFLLDVATWTASIAGVAVASEFLIRRREARKT